MARKSKKAGTIQEAEIDERVIAQADDDSAWGKSTHVDAMTANFEHLAITSDSEILSGETVFRGTRVPVAALLDNIEAGLTLDEFLDNFPTVKREQAIHVLELANKNSVLEQD